MNKKIRAVSVAFCISECPTGPYSIPASNCALDPHLCSCSSRFAYIRVRIPRPSAIQPVDVLLSEPLHLACLCPNPSSETTRQPRLPALVSCLQLFSEEENKARLNQAR